MQHLAQNLVAHLLEDYSPYDIDDPLEKVDPSERNAHLDGADDPEAALDDLLGRAAEDREKAQEEQKMIEAASDYVARKSRRTNPDGSFDKAGRWYPSRQERRFCCDNVRQPTRSFPYSLMLHCRTVDHVANLYCVDARKLRKLVR